MIRSLKSLKGKVEKATNVEQVSFHDENLTLIFVVFLIR